MSDANCIEVESGAIRHKPVLDAHADERVELDWLPGGPFTLGLTAGASTPNNKVGEALVRLLRIRGVELNTTGASVPALG